MFNNQTVLNFDANAIYAENVQVVNIFKDALGYSCGYALVADDPNAPAAMQRYEKVPVWAIDPSNNKWAVDLNRC